MEYDDLQFIERLGKGEFGEAGKTRQLSLLWSWLISLARVRYEQPPILAINHMLRVCFTWFLPTVWNSGLPTSLRVQVSLMICHRSFRGYYGKEEARCPVAADHVLWCQAVLPCLLLPFISSIWICIWYVLMAIVLAKIGTVFCLVQPHCRRVVGKLQVAIKQLFFDENMTELIVQEIPFWGNGTGSNGEMPLIPPKQSFWEMY